MTMTVMGTTVPQSKVQVHRRPPRAFVVHVHVITKVPHHRQIRLTAFETEPPNGPHPARLECFVISVDRDIFVIQIDAGDAIKVKHSRSIEVRHGVCAVRSQPSIRAQVNVLLWPRGGTEAKLQK